MNIEAKILEYIIPNLTHWGYIVVFFMAFLETSAFVGLLIPGESVIVIAGLFAARGELKLWDVMWIASIGAILGDSVGYFIGKNLGEPFFLKYGRYIFFKREYLEHSRMYYGIGNYLGKAFSIGRELKKKA